MKRVLSLGSVLLALSARAYAATCSPTTFIQPASFPSGSSPQAVAVGDFTNDGKLDIVVGLTQSIVSVLAGDGASGFGPPISSPGIYQPGFIATGHFDSDANLDLAIVSSYGGLFVLLGNGNGTFQPPVSYNTGYGPSGLVVGDFNHDDILDIATTSDNGSDLAVLIGNGDGTFQDPVFTTESEVFRSLSIGDFDGDGNPDLVAPTSGNTVRIYPGLGNGTFGVPIELQVGTGLQGSAVGHFGGAGLDFAVTTDTYVAVVRGNGDGTFQAAVDYPLNTFAYSLITADIDGDGRDDLAALSLTSNSAVVSVLSQQADGTMGPAHAYEVGRVSPAFAAGDFEGDGRARLVFAAYDDDRVSVVLSTGPRPLLAPQTVPVARSPRAILATDFNGDVLPDLAVLGDQITILTAGADGFFRILSTTPVDGGVSMAAGDFNADTKLDLAVTTYSQLIILMGNGDGTFQPPVAYPGPFNQQWITVNDFTGDGTLDIALTDGSNGNFGGHGFHQPRRRDLRAGAVDATDPLRQQHPLERPGRQQSGRPRHDERPRELHFGAQGQRGRELPGAARLRDRSEPDLGGGRKLQRRRRPGSRGGGLGREQRVGSDQ